MTEAVASRLAGSNDEGFEVVVEAPVNIALVKYWGKRNEVCGRELHGFKLAGRFLGIGLAFERLDFSEHK